MLRTAFFSSAPRTSATSSFLMAATLPTSFTAVRTKKFLHIPTGDWDSAHEDINAHVKKRVPGETRDERSKRFAREWRNVELELGIHKDSRGRELRYRKTYVYRYTYPNSFDDHWYPSK